MNTLTYCTGTRLDNYIFDFPERNQKELCQSSVSYHILSLSQEQ